MLITEFRNSFDLSERGFECANDETFGAWVARQGNAHLIALVVFEGREYPRARWDELAGDREFHVLIKPGDPLTIAVSLLLSVGTSLLMPKPKVPKGTEASPTYTIGAQQNSARLGSPIPVHYGRHRIWPDLLTQPFAVYNNNDQYLYQLFCLGVGEFDVEDLQIDDTPVSSFSEITYQYYYNQPVTLFPTDVVTSSEPASQEITQSALGPFVASGPGTEANRIEVDVVWESGLFYARSSGDMDQAVTTILAQYREIDSAGDPLGDWQTLASQEFSDASRTPKRVTLSASVSPGRYEVRVSRGEPGFNGPKYFSRCVWEGLRAYLEDDAKTYTGLTVLAVRARATGNLSANSSKRFNLVATRKLPTIDSAGNWNPPEATRSIAWALADIIRAHYGADRADALIDLDKLQALHAIWEEREDEFNYRFDVTTTLWEALKVAARAGRAFPIMNSGVISFVRTAAQAAPATMFNRNNLRNFRVEYSLLDEEANDAIIAEYIDPESGWVQNQVLCQPPSSPALNPKRVQYYGIIDRDQAFREGIYEAESILKQRKTARFETELDGYIPARGDLIIIANEDFAYEQGGEIVAVDGSTLTTSEPLVWEDDTGYAIRLRKPDGSMSGPHLVSEGSTSYECVLNSPLDWSPETGGDQVRTLYQFGVVGSTKVEWIVQEIRPKGGYIVEVVAVNEVDSVHTVDEAEPPASLTPAPIASNEDAPIIRALLVEYTSNPAFLHIAWSPAPGAEYYVIERRVAAVEGEWSDWAQWTTTTATSLEMLAPPGFLEIRVAGIGRAKGPWKIWSGEVGQYVIQSPTALTLTSELVLAADGNYHAQISFTFTPPVDDYHIVSFEAEYMYPRHNDWQPLYNALEAAHLFTTAELGEIHVRVRSVYVQGEIFSDWAEASIINLGTYASIAGIGLNAPLDPQLFVTLDQENRRADIRVSVSYDTSDGARPEKFLLFYAVDDIPNQLVISTDAGSKLYLGAVNIEGQFTLAAQNGSTTTAVKYSDPTDQVDVDLSGMWWFRIESGINGNTRYHKVTKVDTSTFYINPAEPLPFTPQAGDTIRIIEVSYHDSRLPEFSLAYIDGEVVRHGGVSHDGQYYVVVEERGAEGTAQANQSGKTLNYFPAFGADTQIAEINLEEFTEEDGVLSYTGNVPVRLPSGFAWAAVSCCFVRRGTSDERVAWVRSPIVPLTVGGPA